MESKPCIAFVTGSLANGGAERVISIISSALAKKYNVCIICYYDYPIFYTIDERIEVINMESDWHCYTMTRKAIALRKFITDNNIKVILPFMLPYYTFTIFSLFGTCTKIIASERSDPRKESLFRRLLSKLALLFTSILVVQTEGVKKCFPKKILYKIRVIYNPVNRDFIDARYIPSNRINIISVGRLYPSKNHMLLISAFAELAEKYDDIILTIYGEGPQREDLENLIKKIGLQERIFLPGPTINVLQQLEKASIFVCSSNHEGMPNAVIEAMVVGVPTISTRVYGSIDLIQNEVNGLLVEIGDLNGMREAIEKLLIDESLRTQIGIAAKQILKLVHPDSICEQWIKLVDQCYSDSKNI